MKDVADALRGEVESALPRLRRLSDRDAEAARAPGKWVRKEILGHLIDSAANNHQRFVRAQIENPFRGPTYEQNAWVDIGGYVRRPWHELIDLWAAMNRHLAHIIESTPESKLAVQCVIGRNEPASLEWVMRDYVRHLRHHLEQIFAE
jgi:hypothetical protein